MDRAALTPGAGLDWLGCRVDDDLVFDVDQTEGTGSADGDFGERVVVHRDISPFIFLGSS